jgi:transcriptional regulator with XRE-family HTH domain
MISIGEKIKSLRKRNEMTQHELAAEIGVSQRNISAWEIGRNEPTIFNCIVLADYFGITLDELCCRK